VTTTAATETSAAKRARRDREAQRSDARIQLELELRQYLEAPRAPKDEGLDILAWWRENRHAYPVLADIARLILCIPATSAPSERMFSTARAVIRENRFSLSSDSFDSCVFLCANQNFEAVAKPSK
jgi:hypothetical protein